MNKSKKQSKINIHNFVAMHMHINKGGRHGPSKKAIRRKEKVDMNKNICINYWHIYKN